MGRIIAVTCTMPLIKLFGNDQAAWVKVMSIWAAIAFLLLITCFVKCEETVHITARSEEKIPVGRSLKALVTNQYFWAVLLLWMFQSTNQAVVGTILPYYCKYVFHNDSWMYSTLYLSETIVLIVFTFLCPLLQRYARQAQHDRSRRRPCTDQSGSVLPQHHQLQLVPCSPPCCAASAKHRCVPLYSA